MHLIKINMLYEKLINEAILNIYLNNQIKISIIIRNQNARFLFPNFYLFFYYSIIF